MRTSCAIVMQIAHDWGVVEGALFFARPPACGFADQHVSIRDAASGRACSDNGSRATGCNPVQPHATWCNRIRACAKRTQTHRKAPECTVLHHLRANVRNEPNSRSREIPDPSAALRPGAWRRELCDRSSPGDCGVEGTVPECA